MMSRVHIIEHIVEAHQFLLCERAVLMYLSVDYLCHFSLFSFTLNIIHYSCKVRILVPVPTRSGLPTP